MNNLRKLKAAQQAIRAFEPERSASLLAEIDVTASGKLSLHDQSLALAILQNIAAHATAAAQGIAAAKAQLAELRSGSRSLGTYDRAGKRSDADLSTTLARKF
ncbi:hypothetical protein [Paracoccus laeviglucosivorans]|uniref:Uncharacterized protein n=1 Tax=Paracoccus laeviglucosivorans TaxID=1197861 RepID=A0A521F971_9RHOB|nr:hypothetical protein [Paracoccus laeviglucosivorans]SMO92040.1 hypothetical protein SAMN06265221_11878 [Paracoccus laeviglucosivorans]